MIPLVAIKYILIEWVFYYHTDGLPSCLYQRFLDPISDDQKNRNWQAAKVVVFGTYQPSDVQVESFIEVYQDWMLRIYDMRHSVMAGEAYIDTIIAELIIEKKWTALN